MLSMIFLWVKYGRVVPLWSRVDSCWRCSTVLARSGKCGLAGPAVRSADTTHTLEPVAPGSREQRPVSSSGCRTGTSAHTSGRISPNQTYPSYIIPQIADLHFITVARMQLLTMCGFHCPSFSRRFSKKNADYSSYFSFFKTNELTDFISFISCVH